MKYLLPTILAVVLFSSCDITKRRYMPGYSIEWRHRAPKPIPTIARKETVKPPALKLPNIPLLPAPVAISRITKSLPFFKDAFPEHAEQSYKVHRLLTNNTSNHISFSSRATVIPIDTTIKQDGKKRPVFFTGDEQEDDYARKGLIDGILALAIPAATFLIMFAIALSLGETLASVVGYAVAIFILGCAIGLFFSVFAFINGFLAINEIDANSDIYIGRGDAILGMILAGVAVIGAIAYLAIRYL